MPTVAELSPRELSAQLRAGELRLRVGPYNFRLHSNLSVISEGLRLLYGDFSLAGPECFVDFDTALLYTGLSHRLRRRAEFLFDGQSPFNSIPLGQAYAFLEWGMNWCVSLHMNEYLKLHAAVVARNGRSIIMPGIPGAGKSTLCAALALKGWRVLSDEHAMLPPGTTDLIPLCRPVSLKNESIEVIKRFSSDAVFGPVSRETHKGIVAHMKADLAQDSHDERPVPAGALLFPRYSTEEPQRLYPRRRSESFILSAYHSFNYSLMGENGFQAMCKLVDSVPCYDLVYRDLDWATAAVEELEL
jgi:HprK-related kinase A